MRIVLLIDGFQTQDLLESLSRLVRLGHAELLLVYVRGPRPRAGLELVRRRPGGYRLSSNRERELAEAESTVGVEAMTEAETLARRHASSVDTVELHGEPGRVICDVAVRRNADLVVVRAGGRDRPPMGPGSLGPTARYITDHCACPVLLVRTR